MSDAAPQSVLRRMALAGTAAAMATEPVLPARALAMALCRAANSEISLPVAIQSSAERIASLPELLDSLPEPGLLAVVEGPQEAQGLLALDAGLLAALIEKQTMGALSPSAPASRRATRTDAALAANFLDAMLREFEAGLEGRAELRWASGFGYSSHVEEVRPLGLLLEEVDYRVFTVVALLGSEQWEVEMIVALPAEGRAELPVEDATQSADAEDAAWHEALADSVGGGDIRLEAVLHRFRMPISSIARLIPGEEIPLPVSAIDNVRFVSSDGRAFGRGRLGQSQGQMAVRLHAGADEKRTGGDPFDNARIQHGNDGAEANADAAIAHVSEDVTAGEASSEADAALNTELAAADSESLAVRAAVEGAS